VYETVDEYVENINVLIRVVEKMPECHLVVRFRPFPGLSIKDLQTLLPSSDHYSIHSEGTFEDFLFSSDLLVSYSSTTIEEALLNRVAVLLYDSQGKYCHIKDAERLDPSQKPKINSCYHINSEEHLPWGMNWIVENHLSKQAPNSLWDRHIFNKNETRAWSNFLNKHFAQSRCKTAN